MNDETDAADKAGQDSPHLDDNERRQAAERAHVEALVIYEVVREQGEKALERSSVALAWSGLAGGLSIGFSFVAEAYLKGGMPDVPWAALVQGFGYSLGFLIVVLGRQELFTETTLTVLIPTLRRPSLRAFAGTMRVWGVVLAANLLGTTAFGALAAQRGIFSADAYGAMVSLSTALMSHSFVVTMVDAGFSGWLIGLMVWLLPGAGPARPLIIILLSYTVALCQFPHVVAGSVEASFAVFAGHASVSDDLLRFLLPTLIGNIVGGSLLTALLNHAPVAGELAKGGRD